MIIDELVTTLKYDMPASSKSALDKMEKGMSGAARKTTELVDSFGKLNPVSEGVSKTLHKIGDQLAGIAIGATSAGVGIASALVGLALYEGKQANTLKNLSDSIGLNAQEISIWSAAIKSAGGSADAFKSDLQKLNDTYGRVSFDDILKDADELAKLSLPEAMFQGKAWGYGEDAIRFIHQGSNGIRKALEEARSFGQGALQQHIEQLTETNRKYQNLTETIGGITTRIAGEAAPGVGKALDTINTALATNQGAVDGWAKSITGTFGSVIDGIVGKIDTAESRISAFNGKLSSENAAALDTDTRDAEFKERKSTAQGQIFGDVIRTVADMVAGDGSVMDALNRAGARRAKIMQPVMNARIGEQVASRGDDSFWLDMQKEMILETEKKKKWHRGWRDTQIGENRALALAREKGGLLAPGMGEGLRRAWEKQGYSELEINSMGAGVAMPKLDSVASTLKGTALAEMMKSIQDISSIVSQVPKVALPAASDMPRRDVEEEGRAMARMLAQTALVPQRRGPLPSFTSDMLDDFSGGTKGGKGMPGGGGTTIEHQTNNFYVTGSGNPEATAQKTLEMLGVIAPGNGFIPFFK